MVPQLFRKSPIHYHIRRKFIYCAINSLRDLHLVVWCAICDRMCTLSFLLIPFNFPRGRPGSLVCFQVLLFITLVLLNHLHHSMIPIIWGFALLILMTVNHNYPSIIICKYHSSFTRAAEKCKQFSEYTTCPAYHVRNLHFFGLFCKPLCHPFLTRISIHW